MLQVPNPKTAFFVALLLVLVVAAPFRKTRAAAPAQRIRVADRLTGLSSQYISTLYSSQNGSVGCRGARIEEGVQVASRDLNQELTPIEVVRTNSATGLTINLRATSSLDQNPDAKAAFQRAAALWEAVIRTPITIIIDVDFGETWFGTPYPDGVVGFTNPQMLAGPGLYQGLKQNLVLDSSTQQELSLYYSMPDFQVPTDVGDLDTVIGSSALFRAVGFIEPEADPAMEPQIWGPPPAIGLNSSVAYDFDPSDGIDPDKEDFESVAAHEIGHVLGFESAVGQLEVNPDCTPALAVWDLFRVRPGAGLSGFGTAERILSSGGSQVFFDGAQQWALSTGQPDGAAGDAQQPSHWKDDLESGQRIGVMDPTIAQGRQQSITFKDLSALDIMGYALKPIGNSPPSVNVVGADLNGDVLTLNVIGTDPDGDVVQAKLTMLDQKDHLLGETAPFEVDAGVPRLVVLNMEASGLSASPDAMHVGLTLIDTHGNKSSMAIADFSQGDKGGPTISAAAYKKGVLVIKGKRLQGAPTVEINGQPIVSGGTFAVEGSKKKVTVEAPAGDLNIRTGSNRVRIINNGLRSNLITLGM